MRLTVRHLADVLNLARADARALPVAHVPEQHHQELAPLPRGRRRLVPLSHTLLFQNLLPGVNYPTNPST